VGSTRCPHANIQGLNSSEIDTAVGMVLGFLAKMDVEIYKEMELHYSEEGEVPIEEVVSELIQCADRLGLVVKEN